MSSRAFGVLGAVFGFIGVAAGPLAIHHMHLAGDMRDVFETGVRYQLIHAVALLLVAIALDRAPGRWLVAAGWLFVLGNVFFPFGLYAFATTGNHAWALVTPGGGVCYLAAWVALAIAFLRRAA
jgi:uncharacterized membrane protein YgdD (TMEM256/DUF423 family)